MATKIRRTAPQTKAFVDAFNSLKAQDGAGAFFHLDAYEGVVTAADAVDAPTAIALANNILAVYNGHVVDLLAHKASDADEAEALAPCVDNTTCIALVLDLAAQYEAHRVETASHYNADATNALASTVVTTIGHAETVGTDLKAKLNAHMASAPTAASLRLVSA